MSCIDTKLADAAVPSLPRTAAVMSGLAFCHMMKLEPLGRKILAIFLATAYLAEKMSTILNLMSAAHPRCYLARML